MEEVEKMVRDLVFEEEEGVCRGELLFLDSSGTL